LSDHDNIRHHSGYVSEQQVIHKCLGTYQNIFRNMPLEWYAINVYDSVNRKGYNISYRDVHFAVNFLINGPGIIKSCPHCGEKLNYECIDDR
jgi:hypothetical protein